MSEIEDFWAAILGGDAQQLKTAYTALPLDEQQAVYAHLWAMATEEGWSEPQREAAQAALQVIDTL